MEKTDVQRGSGLITPGGEALEPITRTARRVLAADELYRMKDVRPRFEKELRYPGLSRARSYLFSIDGILDGAAVSGAMFAGEAILVHARNFDQALKLAKDGLKSTLELLEEELILSGAGAAGAMTVLNQGLEQEAGGKRAKGDGTLATDPKMRHMLEHAIGGLPWKW